MDATLKLCPFCGAMPELTKFVYRAKRVFQVECTNVLCEVTPSVSGDHLAGVVDAWNRRHQGRQ